MAKTRSPGYPAIGLKESIDKVRAIYDADYQNPIPRAVAAAHMGYKSLNGKSLGVLSALAKFGLLEGRGDNTRVSDLAVAIIAHPPGAPERSAAIKEAAAAPELFAEIEGRYPGGKTSDQAIRSYLMTQKFIPSAADAAIRSYRETKQLIDAETRGSVSESTEIDFEDYPFMQVPTPEQQRVLATQNPPRPHVTSLMPTSGGEPFRVTFLGNAMEISGRIDSAERADELIGAINALKVLLRPVASAHKPPVEDDKATS